MIRVNERITLDEAELRFDFIRSTGPGGQNVNKVATAVQLRFDVLRSPSLPDDVKRRFPRVAGHRLTDDGVVIITSRTERTQERNRQVAVERLVALIRAAAFKPRKRIKTRPSAGSRERRLQTKRKRSARKSLRRDMQLD